MTNNRHTTADETIDAIQNADPGEVLIFDEAQTGPASQPNRDKDEQERAIALVVSSTDGVSDRVIDGLDEEFGSAMAIANASPNELQVVDGIGPSIARKIHRRTRSARKEPEMTFRLYSRERKGYGLR